MGIRATYNKGTRGPERLAIYITYSTVCCTVLCRVTGQLFFTRYVVQLVHRMLVTTSDGSEFESHLTVISYSYVQKFGLMDASLSFMVHHCHGLYKSTEISEQRSCTCVLCGTVVYVSCVTP